MEDLLINLATKRYAVVTGANKGLGFETCRQLASKGITVVLTARDAKRGFEAQHKLKEFGDVVFHQLDVLDPASVSALVDFIRTNYGKLDILVNNAGCNGLGLEGDVLAIKELVENDVDFVFGREPAPLKAEATFIQTLDGAEECVQTNYYGSKRMTAALIPLLQLSDSPRIVNVSSLMGNLKLFPDGWAKGVLSNGESLTEAVIEDVLGKFLDDFKQGSLKANAWPTEAAAYKVTKAALSAYTRVVAKKYVNMCINCVCPGFVATDMTVNLGTLTPAEGTESIVKLALLPAGGPSGLFFYRHDELYF